MVFFTATFTSFLQSWKQKIIYCQNLPSIKKKTGFGLERKIMTNEMILSQVIFDAYLSSLNPATMVRISLPDMLLCHLPVSLSRVQNVNYSKSLDGIL
jgi:hypothetical protein